MSEIMPIPSSAPLAGVAKVEREQRKNGERKQRPQKTNDDEPSRSDDQPVQHVDEVV